MTYFHDYETEPIGGGNPYYRCVHCKMSDPAINGRLEGHRSECAYRLAKEKGMSYPLAAPGNECSIIFSDATSPVDTEGCHLPQGHDGPHEFVAKDGVVWCWETDLSCNCEHCLECEGDYCSVYWKKPKVADPSRDTPKP